jgi:filamentous hemagglutinin
MLSDENGSLTIRLDGGEPFSQSELRAAAYLSKQGRSVLLRSPHGTRAEGGTSDLIVDGRRFDVITPETGNVNRIIGAIARKNSQASGIIVDLSLTTVTPGELANVLARVQGVIRAGGGVVNIQEIVVMVGGS